MSLPEPRPQDNIYDVESYPNVFTLYLIHPCSGKEWVFEISHRRNDRDMLIQCLNWLRANGHNMVGFNNEGYDYPVIHFVYENPAANDPAAIYEKSMSIINSPFADRFSNIIWPRDRVVRQIDLLKIHHFDNQAKGTSLKQLEFAMRASSIEDLPYEPGTVLTDHQIDFLIKYNRWDTLETGWFYQHSLKAIKFRDELGEKYGEDFTNDNDTKIGEKYFIKRLEQESPGSCYTRNLQGKRIKRQTPRNRINLGELIYPYVQFSTPAFNAVKDWLCNQTITKTKKVFSELPLSDLREIIPYMPIWTDEKKGPALREWYNNGCVGDPPNIRQDDRKLNVLVNDFPYVFGTGGIHGSVESRTIETTWEKVIIDLDVKAYYPSLSIANQSRPEHLGVTFCDVNRDLIVERGYFAKGTAENLLFKLAGNGTYGKTNSEFSVFYDPAYTMRITINGQLLLCMLSEMCVTIPGLEMIQINTDGLTVYCPRDKVDQLETVRQYWESITGLTLERVNYNRMFIRDVNNYIAEEMDGKLKRKGAYTYGKDLQWHQNHGQQIVARAAEAALVRGQNIEQFIKQHNDIHDFMCLAKVKRNMRLELNGKQVQNTTRYLVTTNGYTLVKWMPPLPAKPGVWREQAVTKGFKVTDCNRIENAHWQDIDYSYYIAEAKKLVEPLQ